MPPIVAHVRADVDPMTAPVYGVLHGRDGHACISSTAASMKRA
jgi:hypothetical protein